MSDIRDQIIDIISPHAMACQDPECVLCEDAAKRATLILEMLLGHDDVTGVLDEYEVNVVGFDGKSVVAWHCGREHGESGKGHVGMIARDLNGNQSGLTLGELVDAAVRHESEDHSG